MIGNPASEFGLDASLYVNLRKFFALESGLAGQFGALAIEIVGLYWHFVDLVWILLFTFVYLLPPMTGKLFDAYK